MSKKHQQKLQAREMRQKEQAKRVIIGISIGLIVIVLLLSVAYMVS